MTWWPLLKAWIEARLERFRRRESLELSKEIDTLAGKVAMSRAPGESDRELLDRIELEIERDR